MYYETRDYPTHGNGEGIERGTRERANAGLTLGIIGTVLGGAALLKRGGIGTNDTAATKMSEELPEL